MNTTDAQLYQDVREVLGARVKDVLERAFDDVRAIRGIDKMSSAQRHHSIERCISLRLIEIGELHTLEPIKQALLAEFPEEAEKIKRMGKAGVNREQDYIWARTAEPERDKKGAIKASEMMRLQGIDRLLQPSNITPEPPESKQ